MQSTSDAVEPPQPQGTREIALSPHCGRDARAWLALVRPLAGLRPGRTTSPAETGAGIQATGHGEARGAGGKGKNKISVNLVKCKPVVAASYSDAQPSQRRNANRGSLRRDARYQLDCPRRAGRDPNAPHLWCCLRPAWPMPVDGRGPPLEARLGRACESEKGTSTPVAQGSRRDS